MTANQIQDALDQILHRVGKPARYVGGETNVVVKDPASCSLRIALAFPDVYEVGMSNLAMAILYDVANRHAAWSAERTFAPWPDMEAAMRERGVPLYTLETFSPLGDMDLVGFSLAHEMGYTNLLNMLDLAGIPVRSSERGDADPIIIAGGHCAFHPEPMAPFVDAFAIGDGEETLADLMSALESVRHEPRPVRMAAVAAVPGMYVPALYEPRYAPGPMDEAPTGYLGVTPLEGAPPSARRRIVEDVDAAPFPENPIVPLVEAVHDRISLEVMRGCTRGCRFCQAGMITRPVRERSVGTLLEQAEGLVRATGHDEISLVSLSTTDHPGVRTLVSSLISGYGGQGVGVSLPSIRADSDCIKLLQDIQSVRKSGLTLAPEAGTQRMRDVINKQVTEEDLLAACETAFHSGWRHIKLYFMIGLPTETDEDVIGIGELARKVLRLGWRLCGRSTTVAAGVSAFVPKPHTPFQWHGRDSAEEIRRKQKLLLANVREKAIKFRFHDAATGQVEAVLAKGDRRMADAIELAWRNGARFDSWHEHFSYERWLAAFAAAGIDVECVANRTMDQAEPLPWDHIDSGVAKGYLRAEARRALNGIPTGDCHTGDCTYCMACDRAITERHAAPLSTQPGETA